MSVVPGGLTPYLQAGDIGIYKSFKDNMSIQIDEWKRSDKVVYTRGGNPRPPSVEIVTDWIKKAWRETPDDVVFNSVQVAGFSLDHREWFISKHDVYGEKFVKAWEERETQEVVEDKL
jgi:hypothetical protein